MPISHIPPTTHGGYAQGPIGPGPNFPLSEDEKQFCEQFANALDDLSEKIKNLPPGTKDDSYVINQFNDEWQEKINDADLNLPPALKEGLNKAIAFMHPQGIETMEADSAVASLLADKFHEFAETGKVYKEHKWPENWPR